MFLWKRNLGLLQTWEVPGLSSCVKIAGADSWEPGLWGSSQHKSPGAGGPGAGGALAAVSSAFCRYPPAGPSEGSLLWCQSHFPSTCHSYQLRLSVAGVQREGRVREAAGGFHPGSSAAQRSSDSHGTLCIHHRVVSRLLFRAHTWGLEG